MKSPEMGMGSPEKEHKEEMVLKLSYKNLPLNLYYDLFNIAENIRLYNFPKSNFKIELDNASLADKVSSDEDNEEKDMGPVTLTLRFDATEDELTQIKKIIEEEFSPETYETQEKIVDNLLSKKDKE